MLTALFPYFGRKRLAVDLVWHALGIECRNYVEPFFGSGAMLLGAPKPLYRRTETVNDLDCMIANFWRAVRAEPEAVARYAVNPVIEVDLHSRHGWLLNQKPALRELMEHPDRYDAKIAGWWVWGMCASIAGTLCSGDGPWRLNESGVIVKKEGGDGFSKQIFRSSAAGILSVSIGEKRIKAVTDWMIELQGRLGEVRVSCGDWSRIMGRAFLEFEGLSAVFLDPPYERGDFKYGDGADRSVAHDVRRGVQPMGIIRCCASPCAAMTVTTMNYWHWVGISATGRRKTAMPKSRNYGRERRFGSRQTATSHRGCFSQRKPPSSSHRSAVPKGAVWA